METSAKLIFCIDDFSPTSKAETFGDLCKKFSQETSLQSDPSDPVELWLSDFSILKKPEGCLATLLALVYTRAGNSCAERYEKILNHIYHVALNHRFQGKWSQVGEVLQQDLFTRGIHGILSLVIKNMTSNDFFGNFLYKVYQAVKLLKLRRMLVPYREYEGRERFRGLRHKIRRRGYNDKGSRRPDHKWLPGPDFTGVEKELQYQELIKRFPPPKDPPKRYFYRSTFGDRSACLLDS
jgi:hypothetical protein